MSFFIFSNLPSVVRSLSKRSVLSPPYPCLRHSNRRAANRGHSSRGIPIAGMAEVTPGYSPDRTSWRKGPHMPQQAWSKKRERQYDHIKEGLEERGRSENTAEEIAARTVNKERARSGEAKESSKSSTDDISSGRRGGLRSHKGSGGRTRDQLYAEAKRKGIDGRSKMTKAELEKAVGR